MKNKASHLYFEVCADMHRLPQLGTIGLARRMVELAKEVNDLRAELGQGGARFRVT